MSSLTNLFFLSQRKQRNVCSKDNPQPDEQFAGACSFLSSSASLTFGMELANSRSSSLCASFPFTMNLPKGERSITPTFSITSLHSLPTGPNQFVLLKLGLYRETNLSDVCFSHISVKIALVNSNVVVTLLMKSRPNIRTLL